MARDITVTFDDDSQHVYQGAPDNVTPTDIEARAQKDFGKKVKALDGGRRAEPAAPGKMETEIPTDAPPRGMQAAMQQPQPVDQGAAPPPPQGGLASLIPARPGLPMAAGPSTLTPLGRQIAAPAETALAIGSGATTGFLGGLLNAGNRIAQQISGIVGGQNAEQIKAGGPSVGTAFEHGMQTGTAAPQIPEAQAQTEAIGTAMQTHGPALMGLGPELGAVGGILARGARPAAAAAGEATATVAKTGAKKAMGVNPEKLKVAKLAEGFGIDVRPDQIMDSKIANITGEAATHVPLSGAKTKPNQTKFNTAMNQLLNPEETSDRFTSETWSKAMDRSGKTVGEVMGGVEVPIESGLGKSLTTYEKGLGTESDATARIGANYVEQLRRQAEENGGTIPGEALRKLDSEIGQKIRSTADGDLKRSLGDLQEHMRDAAESEIKDPADVTRLKDARRQYAWGKLVEPAVAKSIDGNLSPSALMGLVTATKAGKGFMARNAGGRIGDLAKVGKLLREPASSNTAERGAVYGGLAGAGYLEPHTAAGIVGGANVYNRLGPKLTRALTRGEEPPTVVTGGEPPPETPPTGPAGGPGPETPPAPPDPRLVEIAKLREGATDPAVQAALDAHEKTVQADLKTKTAAAKQAASVDALEAAAKATQDPDLRATLQKQADKLRGEKIPVGEATELAGTPTPKPEKVGKIPVGKVVEGQPALPVEKPGPIPTGAATEITPEVIAPEEPIPVGEATDVSPVSNRPAAEVVSNVPKAEPVSNRSQTAEPVSNVPQAEAGAYAHRALFDEAARRGIQVEGRRPSEVRNATQEHIAKEHGLNPMDMERAKNVAQALNIDEKAVEAAATQHDKSPRAFDRAIDQIIGQGGTPVEAGRAVSRDFVKRALADAKKFYKIKDLPELDNLIRNGGDVSQLLAADDARPWMRAANVRDTIQQIQAQAAKIEALAKRHPEAFAQGVERAGEGGLKAVDDPAGEMVRQMSLATGRPEAEFALAKGETNALETKQAANSSEGPAPNPPTGGGQGGAGPGRGGKPNGNPERPSGATGAGREPAGPNRPAATGAERQGNQPSGQAEAIPVGDVIEGAPETQAANNASGESEASSEAINRAAREKAAGQERVLIDRDGTVRPLIGPSAVDQVARPGQVVAQKGIGAKEWTVLSSGADMTKGAVNRALSRAGGRLRPGDEIKRGGRKYIVEKVSHTGKEVTIGTSDLKGKFDRKVIPGPAAAETGLSKAEGQPVGFEKGAAKAKLEPVTADQAGGLANKAIPFGKLADNQSIGKQKANLLKDLIARGMSRSSALSLIDAAQAAQASANRSGGSMMFLQGHYLRDVMQRRGMVKPELPKTGT